MDFNPVVKYGYGTVGLNHTNKVNDTDHMIVFDALNDSTKSTAYKFGAVDKNDMPFQKNTQNVLQEQK